VPTGGIVLINTPSAVFCPARETNSLCARTMHQDRHPDRVIGARMYFELMRCGWLRIVYVNLRARLKDNQRRESEQLCAWKFY